MEGSDAWCFAPEISYGTHLTHGFFDAHLHVDIGIVSKNNNLAWYSARTIWYSNLRSMPANLPVPWIWWYLGLHNIRYPPEQWPSVFPTVLGPFWSSRPGDRLHGPPKDFQPADQTGGDFFRVEMAAPLRDWGKGAGRFASFFLEKPISRFAEEAGLQTWSWSCHVMSTSSYSGSQTCSKELVYIAASGPFMRAASFDSRKQSIGGPEAKLECSCLPSLFISRSAIAGRAFLVWKGLVLGQNRVSQQNRPLISINYYVGQKLLIYYAFPMFPQELKNSIVCCVALPSQSGPLAPWAEADEFSYGSTIRACGHAWHRSLLLCNQTLGHRAVGKGSPARCFRPMSLPSGKHTRSYRTWPIEFVDLPMKIVIFHSKLFVYQRVVGNMIKIDQTSAV